MGNFFINKSYKRYNLSSHKLTSGQAVLQSRDSSTYRLTIYRALRLRLTVVNWVSH